MLWLCIFKSEIFQKIYLHQIHSQLIPALTSVKRIFLDTQPPKSVVTLHRNHFHQPQIKIMNPRSG